VPVPQAPSDPAQQATGGTHRSPHPPADEAVTPAGAGQGEGRAASTEPRREAPPAEPRRTGPPAEEPRRDVPPPARGVGPVGGAVAVSDRATDADLLLDVPQLAVDELSLELEATPLLNRVKLDAKGLEVGLFLKADFGGLADLVGGGRSTDIDALPRRPRRRDGARIRSGLRELLGSTRDAYRELSDRDVQQQLREVHESAREAYTHLAEGGEEPDTDHEPADDERGPEDIGEASQDRGGESRAQATGQRVLQVAKQGGKAAGLTAAGLAGGALLESRRKPHGKLAVPSPKLPLPRRRNRAQAIAHDIRRRLP
jgi:hypothetical protein